MSGEVFYGCTVRRLEGSRTVKGIVGRRTADGWKFLLLFRTALKKLGICLTLQKSFLFFESWAKTFVDKVNLTLTRICSSNNLANFSGCSENVFWGQCQNRCHSNFGEAGYRLELRRRGEYQSFVT